MKIAYTVARHMLVIFIQQRTARLEGLQGQQHRTARLEGLQGQQHRTARLEGLQGLQLLAIMYIALRRWHSMGNNNVCIVCDIGVATVCNVIGFS